MRSIWLKKKKFNFGPVLQMLLQDFLLLFLVAILFSGAILKEGIMRNIWGHAVVPQMTFQLLDSGHRNCLYNFG